MHMDYIKGFTFGWMSGKGDFRKPEAKESLRLMAERTGSSHVIFALAAHQDHPQAVEVKYRGTHLVEDDELVDMIRYARTLGLRVILKPTVNCTDGTWRAHINFLISMCLVSRSGRIGSAVTQHFRSIMQRLQSRKSVRCSL